MKQIRNRRAPDRAQALRLAFQVGFLAVNLWIGAQFYLWVRYYESGGTSWRVSRPPGVEGWLPIASLMNLKAWLLTGDLPAVHPAGVFLFLAFLIISLLLSKSFCSWLCPIGTISEALYKFGERVFGRTLRLPGWLDIPLRGVKYLLLALFLWAVGGMSTAAIRGFLDGPYGMVADVKMLNFFRDLSLTASVVILVLIGLSVIYRNFWCRYACPYGALMGLVSLAGPARIRRDPNLCVDCGKCNQVCPSILPVDRLRVVRSAECTGCYECVSVCPADLALEMTFSRRRRLRPLVLAGAMAAVFFGLVAAARIADRWETRVPEALLHELVPQANRFAHP
ncbi:MAG: 4Fe-4S binding protein [Acidobacteria bacterium]|nr:4Fe-4S binding protein [Acidobacteriota bacterium]